MPLLHLGFQKKVLTQLLEIKDELRRIGKIVEPETGFHVSTLGTEDEFEYLERQLESGNTRAAMVKKTNKPKNTPKQLFHTKMLIFDSLKLI